MGQIDLMEIIIYLFEFIVKKRFCTLYMLGITYLSPHNELVHLPYIAVATNTRAD